VNDQTPSDGRTGLGLFWIQEDSQSNYKGKVNKSKKQQQRSNKDVIF